MRFASVLLLCGLLLLVAWAGPARADDLYTPMVGVRAASMGGAFVGLADDYSAVHWNPAGITNLTGVEMTVSVNDAIPMTSYEGWIDGRDWEAFRDLDIQATSDVKHYLAPGFFAYFDGGPLRGIVDKIGICGYTLCDAGTLWSGDEFYDDLMEQYAIDGPDAFRYVIGDPPDHESHVRAYAVSPVVAKEVMPGLSFGLAAHAVYSHFELRDGGWLHELVEGENDTSYLHAYVTEDDATGWGYGATFGVLYRATDNVSVGASLRTPITITYEGTLRGGVDEGEGIELEQYTDEFDWTFPMWGAIGFAYRDFLFDNMTLTGDLHWTQWSKVDSIVRVGDDVPADANEILLSRLEWEDTIQLRFGLDYRYSRSLSFRLGYRNAPSPYPDDTYDFLFASSTHDAASLGVAYRSDRWTAEFGIEYMVGKTRDVSGAQHTYYGGTTTQDVVVPSFAFTYKF